MLGGRSIRIGEYRGCVMTMTMDSAQATFIEESRDLLARMEQALLRLENEPGDAETIAAMFRAAHTVKGSAGLFGLDAIVSFTHTVESALDRVRDGTLALERECVALLLRCCDHITRQIESVAQGNRGALAAEDEAGGAELTRALKALLSGGAGGLPTAGEAAGETAGHSDAAGSAASGAKTGSDRHRSDGGEDAGRDTGREAWHLSLRFGRDALRNGMDPASFLRYLGSLGTITGLVTLTDAIPAAPEMDPESCYLGFEIRLESGADRAAILGVFDFVRDDCAIRLLPPRSKVFDYLALIDELPEDNLRLGEILVACGALTRAELQAGLKQQREARGDSSATPANTAAGAAGAVPQIGAILVDKGMAELPMVAAALAKQERSKTKRQEESRFVRVPADKLDQLINLVGELVIASAGANLRARSANDEVLHESTQTVIGLVEEIRNGTLQLRMVQIGETFNRFRRVVRDVSQDLGKDIELVINGGETELDKSVVERIGDPLTHLIRNAIDHGIESAEARAAAGKPARGIVSMNAFHESGSIVIEVADDGRGIDRERVLHKARERGLVGANQHLADQEILNLVFLAGFSTAEQVSNLSGRGVGMDVVKRNVEALRGAVAIESQHGQGTKIIIRLPLTLAIIDGFLVGVGRCLLRGAAGHDGRMRRTGRHRGRKPLPEPARQSAAFPAAARAVRNRRRCAAARKRRRRPVRRPAGRPGGGRADGRVPDRDQAARESVQEPARHRRLDHSRQRRSGADPGCGGARGAGRGARQIIRGGDAGCGRMNTSISTEFIAGLAGRKRISAFLGKQR